MATRWWGWLLALLLVACSSDGGRDASAGAGGSGANSGGGGGGGSGVSGSSGASAGGASGQSATGGTSGGGSGAGGGGSDTTLFVDPRAPDCPPTDVGAHIVGTIDGQPVDFELGSSSYIGSGRFEYVEVVAPNTIAYPLVFDFVPGGLTPGSTSRLVGHSLQVPADQPGGGKWYCITSGEFGPVPESEQPPGDDEATFKFRIDGAQGELDCTGDAVEIDLLGCLYRREGSIPRDNGLPATGVDSPECSPLTERFAGHYLDDSVIWCEDDAELTGLPNPTHFGNRQALALREPLEPGRAYAMNQFFGAASATTATVAEVWGQSEPCGAVDELLWVGDLNEAHRHCQEFVPSMRHTHVLRVLRQLDLNGYDSFGDLRICGGGSCGGTVDGQGAAPGATLTTVPGTYRHDGPGQLDGTASWRLGRQGQIIMLDGEGGDFDARELQSLAFRMGPNEPFADRWHCATGGMRTEGDSTRSYYIDVSGITRMPDCSALSGSEALTLTWDHAADRVAVTSSLPQFAGSDLFLHGRCFGGQCDIVIRSTMTLTWHLFATVDGDLGSAVGPNLDVTAPIRDATWLAGEQDGPISLSCGLGGTITRDVAAQTTTFELTGLAAPTACAGEAVTPNSGRFVLENF
jgi:hypothetical protein